MSTSSTIATLSSTSLSPSIVSCVLHALKTLSLQANQTDQDLKSRRMWMQLKSLFVLIPCTISKKLYNIQQTQFQRKRRHSIYQKEQRSRVHLTPETGIFLDLKSTQIPPHYFVSFNLVQFTYTELRPFLLVYRVLARLLFVTNWDKLVIPCTVIVKGNGLNRLLFHLI